MLRNFTQLSNANIEAFEQAFDKDNLLSGLGSKNNKLFELGRDEKFITESSILLYLNYLNAHSCEENVIKIRNLLQICIAKNIITKRMMSRFFINQEFSQVAMHICIERQIQLDNNDFSKYYLHHSITNDEVLQHAIKCNISNINYQSIIKCNTDQPIPEQFEAEEILALFPQLTKIDIKLPSNAIVVDGANWCRIENGTMDFIKLQEFAHFNTDVFVVFNEHHSKKLIKMALPSNVYIIYSSKKVDDDLTCLYIALQNKVMFYTNDNHSNHYGPTGLLHSKQIEIEQFKSKYNVRFEYNKKTKQIRQRKSRKYTRRAL